jgi:flagellin-like hook-associated protein FlgL
MSLSALSTSVRSSLASLQSAASAAQTAQERLATGRRISSPLHGPSNYFTASDLGSRAKRLSSLLDGMGQAVKALEAAKRGIDSLTRLVGLAKSLASQAKERREESATAGSGSFVGGAQTQIPWSSQSNFATATVLTDGRRVYSWSTTSSIPGDDLSGQGVYFTTYDPDLTQGPIVPVNTTVAGDQKSQTVAALADGGFVVTWQSDLQDGSGSAIVGRRYDSSLMPVGGEFAINTHTVNAQESPVVTGLADGGFVVAWQSAGQDGADLGIYGQRFDAAGSAVGGEFRANTTVAGPQQNPSIASLTDGGYVVTWSSGGQDGDGSHGIYGQRYDATGAAVGAEFQVNGTIPGDQMDSSIVGLSTGGFVVSWRAMQPGSDAADIYGRAFDSQGQALGSEFRLNTLVEEDQYTPRLFAGADGGFTATWVSYDPLASSFDLMTRTFTRGPAAVESERLVEQLAGIRGEMAALVADASYGGIALLAGGRLNVPFNEAGTSSLTIASGGLAPTDLGLGGPLTSADLADVDKIDALVAGLQRGLEALSSQASSLGSQLSAIRIRHEFTDELIDTLESGASALVEADTNEEGAILLAAGLRSRLAQNSLALASRADEFVLRLFSGEDGEAQRPRIRLFS